MYHSLPLLMFNSFKTCHSLSLISRSCVESEKRMPHIFVKCQTMEVLFPLIPDWITVTPDVNWSGVYISFEGIPFCLQLFTMAIFFSDGIDDGIGDGDCISVNILFRNIIQNNILFVTKIAKNDIKIKNNSYFLLIAYYSMIFIAINAQYNLVQTLLSNLMSILTL